MAMIEVTLDEVSERFVQEQVESGAYPDREAVLLAAIDRLREDVGDWSSGGTPEEEAQKEARFERLVQEGLDDVAAGRVETVTDTKAWLNSLGRRRDAAA